jgi:PAS domain S-box-containing protein
MATPETLLHFFEAAPEACLITDRYAVIRHANRAAATRFGRAAGHLRGKPLAVFVPLAERREFRRNLTAVLLCARWRCSAFAAEVRRSPSGLCWILR